MSNLTFAADLLDAVGTVGAVVVALVLATAAARADRRHRTANRDVIARQVVFVWRPRGLRTTSNLPPRPCIEIFNGSQEAITNIKLNVHIRSAPGRVETCTWVFDPKWRGSAPYVGDNRNLFVFGSIQRSGNGEEPLDEEAAAALQVRIVGNWADGEGQRWTRSDNEKPVREGTPA